VVTIAELSGTDCVACTETFVDGVVRFSAPWNDSPGAATEVVDPEGAAMAEAVGVEVPRRSSWA